MLAFNLFESTTICPIYPFRMPHVLFLNSPNQAPGICPPRYARDADAAITEASESGLMNQVEVDEVSNKNSRPEGEVYW